LIHFSILRIVRLNYNKPMISKASFLSIIIPAHNEESRLSKTLEEILAFTSSQPFSSEIIIVENASIDRTLTIARDYAGKNLLISVIHDERPGKGLAVKTGMLAASGDYRFICDADLSMPAFEISRFIPPALEGVDIGIASREAPGAIRYNEPPMRHFAGRVFNTLVRLIVLPGLQDTQCGFKCFSRHAAETLFPLQTIPGWTFDVEILAIAQKMGFKIAEVPIPWYYQGDSKVRVIKDSLKMARDLFRIRASVRKRKFTH
jgi:dolichyl-phosphate beta-glucosyltransferase